MDPGLAADLVLYDWTVISGPYLDEAVPLVDALLRPARREAVRAVVVIAGRLIYEDGRFLSVDRVAMARDLTAALSRPLSDAERRGRALSIALQPFVRRAHGNEAEAVGGI